MIRPCDSCQKKEACLLEKDFCGEYKDYVETKSYAKMAQMEKVDSSLYRENGEKMKGDDL